MGKYQAGLPGFSSSAPRATQLWARTVVARLGQRAVYSWKVQVPQTSSPERWTLVSSTALTRYPNQSRPGARSINPVSAAVIGSRRQAPYSTNDSRAFQ